MKKLAFLAMTATSLCLPNALWAWPPGLRSSTEIFRGHADGPEIRIASFGDSIASGYNSSFWLTKIKGGTYADHLGKWLNGDTDRDIRVENLAWAGFTLQQILGAIRKNHIREIKKADVIFLEGGGNDFLDLYGEKYIDLCKPENFYPTLENTKQNFLEMIRDVEKNKQISSRVKVLGIYYPLVHATKARACQLRSAVAPSVHAAFINAMAKFNWFLAKQARERGYSYVDNFAHLNCSRENWAKCKLSASTTENQYVEKIVELDIKDILRDPADLGWLQKDHVHPNTDGHELISWVIRNSR